MTTEINSRDIDGMPYRIFPLTGPHGAVVSIYAPLANLTKPQAIEAALAILQAAGVDLVAAEVSVRKASAALIAEMNACEDPDRIHPLVDTLDASVEALRAELGKLIERDTMSKDLDKETNS